MDLCSCDCHKNHCKKCTNLIPVKEVIDSTGEIFIIIPYLVILILFFVIVICALFGNESCSQLIRDLRTGFKVKIA